VSDSPLHYYIYYRIALDHADAAAHAVRRIVADVEKRTGIAGRWLRRRDDALLWMEAYEGVSDRAAFEAALADAVTASGLTDCLAARGTRTVERFVSAGDA
jgi:uncharacterized protein DUF4936